MRFDGRLPLWAVLLRPLVDGVMRAGRLAPGCYLFCARAAFEAVGGFDERLYVLEEIALSRALRRKGKIIILRETVLTSGRKLRLHSGWEILQLLAQWVLRGAPMLRSRERLAMWYGPRRADPDDRA